ncbi:hypothetical protein CC80DRAFT_540256 [Byssothecium circinans]|uniref:Uncharacterized protein n=1 Tax=Byssothecium circinans TaxID=147558 RepID=A0A6A5TF63_9PLEO|nr:hypothetical protein CC80DRAFT_540256 [Byssothecium circinans]
MALTTATLLVLKAVAVWILVQCGLELVETRLPAVTPGIKFMRACNSFAATTGTTFCALLVLLPSFVFVVLEVFGYVRERTRMLPSKSLSEYVERGVRIINELEALGERVRMAATKLSMDDEQEEFMCEQSIPHNAAPGPNVLPQACGNVLLAVCRHSESMERLYSTLQPPGVDDLIYCDCEDFEIRGQKIVSMLGMLRECMERQTEVVQAVDALCPMMLSMVGCSDDDGADDSGFIDYVKLWCNFDVLPAPAVENRDALVIGPPLIRSVEPGEICIQINASTAPSSLMLSIASQFHEQGPIVEKTGSYVENFPDILRRKQTCYTEYNLIYVYTVP